MTIGLRGSIVLLTISLLDPGCEGQARNAVCELPREPEHRRMQVAGGERGYWVIAGPDAVAPAATVFLWHGWGDNARSMMRALDPERHWREAVVVAAEGLPRRFPGLGPHERDGWQIRAGEFGDRDLALFDSLVDELVERGCADRARLYSTGFSNGGFFSHLLGCERAVLLAAIAPVGGGGPQAAGCDGALPVHITHGTRDEVVPYEGARASYRSWGSTSACRELPAADPTGCVHGVACREELTFCSFAGGHRWPPGATSRIVEFLRRH